MRGRFVTIEGGEGAGKSTQIKLLSSSLTQAGIEHILTREPGGSEGAESIRALIVTGDKDRWDPVTEALLIMAARAHHVQHTILPALEAGKWVLCDRFFDSTCVYQGIAKGLGLSWLRQLYALTIGAICPDLTLLYDIDPQIGVERAIARHGHETRFEDMPFDFHQALREGFLHLAKEEKERFIVIDASRCLSDIHSETINLMNVHLGIGLAEQKVAA